LAHKIIGDELGIKEKTASYLTPKKSDKMPDTHSSNSLKRNPNGRFKTMLPKEDLVEKYGRTPVYGQIIEYILKNLKGEIKLSDIAKQIYNFYRNVLNKDIVMHTARTYAATYTRIMEKNNQIVRIKRNIFYIPNKDGSEEFTKKEKKVIKKSLEDAKEGKITELKVEKPKKKNNSEKIGKEIYRLALKHSWILRGEHLIKLISKELKKDEEEIKLGMSYLIKERKAMQSNNNKVRFL